MLVFYVPPPENNEICPSQGLKNHSCVGSGGLCTARTRVHRSWNFRLLWRFPPLEWNPCCGMRFSWAKGARARNKYSQTIPHTGRQRVLPTPPAREEKKHHRHPRRKSESTGFLNIMQFSWMDPPRLLLLKLRPLEFSYLFNTRSRINHANAGPTTTYLNRQ